MSTELVIKVKHGETLRRFSVLFNKHGSLDLDMAGLRDKVFNLFKFTPDADVTLTYLDEDNDVVTLVDDADLSDAIKQHLDPLRIVVSLNSDSGGKLDSRSGSSTPMRSPSRPLPFSVHMAPHSPPTAPPHYHFAGTSPVTFTNAQVSRDRAWKASSSNESFPGQEQSPWKFVQDMASKAASITPEQYRDFVSKLSHDWLSKAAAGPHSPALSKLVELLSKAGIPNQDSGSVYQIGMDSNKASDAEKMEDFNVSDIRKALGELAAFEVLSNAKNGNLACNAANLTRSASTSNPQNAAGVQVCNDTKNSEVSPGSDFTPLVCCNSGTMPRKECSGKMPMKECNSYPNGNQRTPCGSPPPSTLPLDDLAKPVAPQNGSASGQMGISASVPVQSRCPYFMPPFERTFGNSDNMGRVFHQGVRCDGCGVHPITGPRFKSKVKEDYDLCSICFADFGNAAEYTRMDRPMCYRSPRSPRMLHPARVLRHALPHGLRNHHGPRPSYRSKLDSRYIEDVNILDGTLMAPSTPFTKIWRMHNNGTVAWPRGTQLVFIGGDQLTDVESVEVELPIEGCLVGAELNVAIDFVAPERHGQYISYWKMALPSGQTFGQCIWVLIEVDTPQRDSQPGSGRNLNLNLPPDCGDLKDDQINLIIDVNVEPPEVDSTNMVAADEAVRDGIVNSQEMPAVESYPLIDLSVIPSEPTTAITEDVKTFSGDASTREQLLLKELDEMGFKEIDLNKEILRVNKYDLDRSLDDLCDAAEWDPMLEDLEEMGFLDKETNRKLLKKNGGSIKRVVMDLIAAEKA